MKGELLNNLSFDASFGDFGAARCRRVRRK